MRRPSKAIAAALWGAAWVAGAPAVAQVATVAVPADTPVRLMVLNEVTSRTARVGDRFLLLLDRALTVDGRMVAAVGAKAWGEVVETRKNGSAGTSGRLAARLLWLETADGRLPLRGDMGAAGANAVVQMGVAGVAMGMFAPIALLARGNDGKLKAGEIVTGLVAGPALSGRSEPAPPPR